MEINYLKYSDNMLPVVYGYTVCYEGNPGVSRIRKIIKRITKDSVPGQATEFLC